MDPRQAAMQKVIEDMGRHANRGRATRFTRKKMSPVAQDAGETHDGAQAPRVGGPLIEDAMPPGKAGDAADSKMPPQGSHEMGDMTPAELEELMGELQR